MKLRISGLLAIAAFAVFCLLGSAQSLAQNAYITNGGSNTVSVINTRTNTVIATIPVGIDPYGVAVTPDRGRVYITNHDSNNVSVIDIATNSVSATIPVGSFPTGVAVTPDGRRVYVATSGNVSMIVTEANRVTATIPVPGAYGVAVSPDGSKVYVASDLDVSVITVPANRVIATIPVDEIPFGMALSPDGSKLYVVTSAMTNGILRVIDTTANAVTSRICCLGHDPFAVAVSPDGSKVYVTNNFVPAGSSGTVSVISPTENTVTDLIRLPIVNSYGAAPLGVAITPDGSQLYVAASTTSTGQTPVGEVVLISTATNTVTATIPVGLDPIAFGNFIQPAVPQFAGVPGGPTCYAQSAAALTSQYGGPNGAAAALGFPSITTLQNAIMGFCEGTS